YLALGRAGIFGRSRHGCIALSSGCYCRYPSKFFRRVSITLLWVAHRNISRLFQREYRFAIRRSCVLTPRNSEVADLWRAPRCFGERLKSLSQFLTNLVLLRPHRNFLPPVVSYRTITASPTRIRRTSCKTVSFCPTSTLISSPGNSWLWWKRQARHVPSSPYHTSSSSIPWTRYWV